MKIVPVTEIKAQFNAFLRTCREEPVVVTRKGKMVAVLLSVENEEDLERLVLSHSSEFQKISDTGKQQIKEGKGIRHEDFWEEPEP